MKQKIIEILKTHTNHNYIELTPSGDTAIFAALYIARQNSLDKNNNITKKNVLIPDQGGWLTYKKYPKMLELNAVEVKTDHGIIDLDDLNGKLKDACCFIYANPAGYFAEQPMKEIYSICKEKCFVILDASGSIGTELCDGNFADICVGSFGKWKPVNLEYGGFISLGKKFEKGLEIFNTTVFDEKYFNELLIKLNSLKERHELFFKINKKIKNDLKDFNIIHKGKKGINVAVKFNNEEEKKAIMDYCSKNSYEYTLCPRYIRVNCDAVSIEVKRL